METAPPGSPPPTVRRRRRLTWPLLVGCACGVALIVIPLVTYVAFMGSADRRLRQALARLKASGAPMTLAEAAPPEVPADQNAAVLYEQAFNALPSGNDMMQIENFVSSHPAIHAKPSAEEIQQIFSAYEYEFRLLRAAAARPACHFPVNWNAGPAAVFPHYAKVRAAARLLAAKTLVDAHQGRSGEATDSVALILRMGDHISEEPMLIGQLVRVAAQSIATNALNRAMEISPPSARDARRMYERLRKTDNTRAFTRAIEGERCYGLWVFDWLYRDPAQAGTFLAQASSGSVRSPPRLWATPLAGLAVPFMKQDEVFYLRQMNRLVELSRLPFREAAHEYEAVRRDVQALPRYAVGSKMLVPVFTRATAARDNGTALIGLAQHGMALRAYQEAMGRYPATLEELRKVIHWPLPKDPFSGRDFIYRRQGKGYLIYTIGRNMKDDGGWDPRSGRSGGPWPGDFAWRMSR